VTDRQHVILLPHAEFLAVCEGGAIVVPSGDHRINDWLWIQDQDNLGGVGSELCSIAVSEIEPLDDNKVRLHFGLVVG